MDTIEGKPPQAPKDVWDKASIGIDLFYKVVILIIGSVAAALFYYFQDKQNQSHYFADLMAQRENADSQLRAQMFKTLFDAYFANKLQTAAIHPRAPSGDAFAGSRRTRTERGVSTQLTDLKRQTMFTDLLSRNFEDIDVRPLLEDIDAQLAALVLAGRNAIPMELPATAESQHQAFGLREQLRRAAIGTSSRQITALVGGAKARTTLSGVSQCASGPPAPVFPFEGMDILVDHMKDGKVAMHVNTPSGRTDFSVTFYDMPLMENMVLPSGDRVAITLSRYVSHESCKLFATELDESIKLECEELLQNKQVCDRAWLHAVVFPENYIAARDRPYVNDLLAGKFR